jgi:F-type H+-transporting ATPase subunit b
VENFDWIRGFIVPYINFAIFIVLGFFFFRKPLSQFAKNRRADFEKDMHAAQHAKNEALATLAKIDERLASLQAEMETIRQNSIDEAERESARIISDAQKQANFLIEEAKMIVDGEALKARSDILSSVLSKVRTQVEEKLINELKVPQQKVIFQSQLSKLSSLQNGRIL